MTGDPRARDKGSLNLDQRTPPPRPWGLGTAAFPARSLARRCLLTSPPRCGRRGLRPRLGIRAAGLAVHERVRRSRSGAAPASCPSARTRVGAEQDVTGKARDGRDATAEARHDRGMARVAGVAEPGSGDGSDAVRVDDVQAPSALTGAPGPRSCCPAYGRASGAR